MKYLPIGTVVLLKNAEKKLMIEGYMFANENDPGTVYDYGGVMYPEGRMDSDHFLLFNEDMIEEVIAYGYVDGEARDFLDRLSEVTGMEDDSTLFQET
jgi:hypothetical protein